MSTIIRNRSAEIAGQVARDIIEVRAAHALERVSVDLMWKLQKAGIRQSKWDTGRTSARSLTHDVG
jgi:hypothetical protein